MTSYSNFIILKSETDNLNVSYTRFPLVFVSRNLFSIFHSRIFFCFLQRLNKQEKILRQDLFFLSLCISCRLHTIPPHFFTHIAKCINCYFTQMLIDDWNNYECDDRTIKLFSKPKKKLFRVSLHKTQNFFKKYFVLVLIIYGFCSAINCFNFA